MSSNESSGGPPRSGRGEEWLNTAQAAHMLGINKRTLDGWRPKGFGPSYYRAETGRVRYRFSEVQSYLDSTRQG